MLQLVLQPLVEIVPLFFQQELNDPKADARLEMKPLTALQMEGRGYLHS